MFLFFEDTSRRIGGGGIASRRVNGTSGRTKDVGGGGTRVISKENGGWLPEHYLMVTAKEGGKKDREIGALVTLRDRNVRVAIFDMTKVRISSRVGCLLPSGRREFYFLFFGKRAENPSNV